MSGGFVNKTVQDTLSILRESFPEEYQTVQEDSEKMKELTAMLTTFAEDELSQQEMFSSILEQSQQSPSEVQKLISEKLGACLPSDRVEMIRKGLQIPTYRLNFRHEDGVYYVDVTRSGEKYMDPIKLDTAEGFESASALQIASIVVEAIGLFLSIVGISIPASKMASVARKVANKIAQTPAVKAAIRELKKVFSSGSGNFTEKAKAVWHLIKAVWNGGNIVKEILHLLLSDMSFWEKTKMVTKVLLMIGAAMASGGAAIVAKIALSLHDAYEFAKKIYNLNELDAIRNDLQL